MNQKLIGPFNAPQFTLSIVLSTVLVNLAILIDENLAAYLSTDYGLAYPWQFLTSLFTGGPVPPFLFHVILLTISVYIIGNYLERKIGAWKLFVLILTTLTATQIIRYQTQIYENGLDFLLWASAPMVIYSMNKKGTRNDPKSNWMGNPQLLVVILIVSIVVITLLKVTGQAFTSQTGYDYAVSAVMGAAFLLLWKKSFSDTRTADHRKNTKWDRVAIISGYSIAFINLLILFVILAFFY